MKALKFRASHAVTMGARMCGNHHSLINIHLIDEEGRKIVDGNLFNIESDTSECCGAINEFAAKEAGVRLNAFTKSLVIETGSSN